MGLKKDHGHFPAKGVEKYLTRGWQPFAVNDQTVNIFDFVCHTLSRVRLNSALLVKTAGDNT